MREQLPVSWTKAISGKTEKGKSRVSSLLGWECLNGVGLQMRGVLGLSSSGPRPLGTRGLP